MDHKVYQIIKEYVVTVEGLSHDVKGRVIKNLSHENDPSYEYQVSHYCKQENTQSTHHPESPYGNTEDEAELHLLDYLTKFTRSGIEVNMRFR